MRLPTIKAGYAGLLFLTLTLSSVSSVRSQGFTDLGVRLRLDKTRYLEGEPIWAEVKITNPDSTLLYACMVPEQSSVSGVQVFSGDGKEIRTRCWDPQVTTPVVLTLPPRRRGFLSRLEISTCFGKGETRAFSPGYYRVRTTFTNISKDQVVQDSAAFEVVAPEGKDKALLREMRKTKGFQSSHRTRLEGLFRKHSESPYALGLAMRCFAGASATPEGRVILRRGIELCEKLIQEAPDQVSAGVLVDSVSALSWRLSGKTMAVQKLKGIAGSYPKTTAFDAAQEALDHLEIGP